MKVTLGQFSNWPPTSAQGNTGKRLVYKNDIGVFYLNAKA